MRIAVATLLLLVAIGTTDAFWIFSNGEAKDAKANMHQEDAKHVVKREAFKEEEEEDHLIRIGEADEDEEAEDDEDGEEDDDESEHDIVRDDEDNDDEEEHDDDEDEDDDNEEEDDEDED
ncbi:ribosomal L1 domain-containing protein CG13096-like isoform X1 [Scylla paramamosain]|uniref:ribosomal L1 domain-containing protein CG13096-like isoform X1 n=1 Tax=Scylla paramamosain TaxID=85552 RepID=UPI00308329AF